MKNLEEMTNEEKSLLLYVETCAVDNGGLVDCRKINNAEREILKQWDKDGFISWSRITFESIQKLQNKNNTSLVYLSENAWELAHEERRNRNRRVCSKEPYCSIITTKTKNSFFEVGQ